MSSKDSPNVKFLQITSSWSKFMIPTIHHITKNSSFHAHSNSCHFSNGIDPFNHVFTPGIHGFGPFGEIYRWMVWILGDIFWRATNVPEISPFGIKRWRTGRSSFIQPLIASKNIFVIFTPFNILWCGTNLIIQVREDFLHVFAGIQFLPPAIKITFHHIKESIIFRLVHTRIFNYQASEFM